MTKRRFAVLLLLVLVAAIAVSLFNTRQAFAQSSSAIIPKSYGTCKGAIDYYVPGQGGPPSLIFEDANGTIRLVSTSGAVKVTYVRR